VGLYVGREGLLCVAKRINQFIFKARTVRKL
jgi:hypothetical protein